MLITDVTAVSPYFRLLNNIRSRKKAIHWQAIAQKKNPPLMWKELEALKDQYNHLLVIQYTHTKKTEFKTINQAFRKLGNTETHIRKIFGDCLKPRANRKVDDVETNMLRKMAHSNRSKRVSELRTRILLEIIEKESKGWYIVFNTLTVANEYTKKVWDKENRVFEKYILALNYAIGKIDGKEKQRTDENHTYFAVVEEGSHSGRLHFHILHFFRHLPNNCHDPNRGRAIPHYRIINGLRRYWPYGFSTPVAVRLSAGDNYRRLNWRWPVVKKGKGYEALAASNPLRMARYMSKYINKTFEEDAFRWRTRLSKGFGTRIINQTIKNLPTRIIKDHLITVSMWKHLECQGIAMPMATTRKIAVKEYLLRTSNTNSTSKISTLQKSIQNIKPQPSIVEQHRTLMNPRLRSSSPNTSFIKTKNLNRMDIFKIKDEFDKTLRSYNYHKRVIEGRGATWQEH